MHTYNLSKEESERLNIVKYIAIIFVVYIHSYATAVNFSTGTNDFNVPNWLLLFETLISDVVSKCGVPIFFLISSILLFKKERNYSETIKSKVKTLLIPYLIWNTVWILIFIGLQSLSFTATFFSGSNKPILQRSFFEWLQLYGIGTKYPQDYPLWFVRDLMVITLFFPIIKIITSKFPKLTLFISVSLLLIPIDFPFKTAVLWFFIGACIVKFQFRITFLDYVSLWKLSIFYILSLIITLLINLEIINSIFIFVSIGYWIRFTKLIYDSKKYRNKFLYLAEWTFMIYVAHELTLTSIKKVCFKILPTSPLFLLIEYITLPIIIIIACSIFGMILKKLTPKIYDILTGSR